MDYLGENWIQGEESTRQSTTKPKLYIWGGFKECTRTVLLYEGSVTPIPQLESTQEEADIKIILHAMYAAAVDDCDKLIIHANDTDVVLLLYHASSLHQAGLKEIWMRTSVDSYLPIHELANHLGGGLCKALPFIHSLTGRDTTSYTYFREKKSGLTMQLRSIFLH